MASTHPTPSVALPSYPPTLSNAQLLQLYIVTAIIAHYCSLFFNGYGGDLGYWFDWISQMSNRGYSSLNVNYPPMYLHWIYSVSKIIPALGLAIENNLLLKALLEIPTLVCHIAIITMVSHLLSNLRISRLQHHSILFITALNPAILFNGPVWGQVDIIPATFALSALLIYFSPRYAVFSIPFYTLAILTKFQMICFAPVMGILFFRQFKTSLKGIAISLVVIAIAFAPFILNHDFVTYFKRAYVNTLGEYAYTTFNAGNMWMLITGNAAPDSYIMFTLFDGKPYAKAITAKTFGMGLFAFVCLWVFIHGLIAQFTQKIGSKSEERSQIVFYAIVCSVAFFALLPAMHERYLFPAVCMSLAYAAMNPLRWIYAVAITGISFINMVIINGVNGSDVWRGLSTIMLMAFGFALIELVIGPTWYIFLRDVTSRLARLKWLGLWAFVAMNIGVINAIANHYKLSPFTVDKNQVLLTSMTPIVASQTHGSLHINRSYDNNALSVGNQHYANGLGTHTASNITYALPPGAKTFSFIVGVDDEVGTADMQFSVWGDGKELWKSKIYYGFETSNTQVDVDITGIRELSLHVDPVTDMQFDHANWINPVITFDHPISVQAAPQP